MFIQYFDKGDFREKYMRLYAMRQAIANLQMEDQKTNLLSRTRTQEMFNNVIAFENVLDRNPEKISPYDLVDIAEDVNIGQYSRGFRKTQVDVRKARSFFPPSARELPQRMYSLFDTYHKIWVDLPVYEKEARLHIELVRLQPFEDGNKRSTRILTNFNLIKQNKAPVIISGDETDEYFDYIDEYNVEGMTKLLKSKSEEELEIILDLYKSLNGDTFDNFVNENQCVKCLIKSEEVM